MNDGGHFENKNVQSVSQMLGHTSGVSSVNRNKKKVRIDKCLETVFELQPNNMLTSIG